MKKTTVFHPWPQAIFKRRNRFSRYTLLCFLGLLLGGLAPLHAQTDIYADGNTYHIATDGNLYNDHKIPVNTNGFNEIIFKLRGADGGHRRVPGLCQAAGGSGANVTVVFQIGNNAGQLKPGGTIRFVPGYEGKSRTDNGVDAGGGGGGTGVLYHAPNANITCSVPSLNLSDAGSCWVLLGVAGGGGGGYSSGVCGGQAGKGGNSGTNGSSGYGGTTNGGGGGSNGNGGGFGGFGGGGGGGYKSSGDTDGDDGGDLGGITGGNGGSGELNGGKGYGGGGAQGTSSPGGGGGGGYSGGGGGGYAGGGGGGGSFANSSAIYNDKKGGGTTNSPHDGSVDYAFQLAAVTPIAVCKDITVQLDANGQGVYHPADLNGGSYDPNGDPISFYVCYVSSFGVTCYDNIVTHCSDLGSNSIPLLVSDGTNNGSCFSNVQVEDNIFPVVTCKSGITVTLDATGHASIVPANLIQSASDNCGIATQTLSQSTFDCSNAGNNTVMVTVADASENATSCNSTVTVNPYTFSCKPDFNVTVPSGSCTAYVDLSSTNFSSPCGYYVENRVCDANFTNCGTIDATNKSGNYPPGSYFIQWILHKPGNGTIINACFTYFNVLPNNDLPTAKCKPATVQLDATGHVTITPDVVDNGSFDLCGPVTESLNISSFDCSKVGNNTVTLIVTKNNGLSKTCTSTVTVQDHVAPTAVCKNKTLPLNAAGVATLLTTDINNGSSDACGISGITLSKTSYNCSNVGANTVTLTATDVNSNTSTCTATVTVQDQTAPTALCKNKSISLNAAGLGSITTADINNGSTDACGIANLSLSTSSYNCSNIGLNVVTLSVTDVNSNTSTCTATVTVTDNIAPTALCHNAILNLNANGSATLPTSLLNNGSSDACGIQTLAVSPSVFSCNDLGPQTVVLTATDPSSNTATCSATVTVKDVTPPTADCKNITVPIDDSGFQIISPSDVAGPNIFEACGVLQDMEIDYDEFTCIDLGERIVTLTLTDGSGNTSSCQSTITVIDVAPPQMHCKTNPFVLDLDANGAGFVTGEAVDDGSYDNCSGDVYGNLLLFMTGGSYTCADIGDNVVTLTAVDESGNTNSCTATIRVQDHTAPTANCNNVTAYLDANGNASTTANAVNNNSYDGCGILSLALNITSFTCSNLGNNAVVLTVTDNHANVSTCNATVTVADAMAPTVTCQPYAVSLNAAGSASITTANVFLSGTDNCGTVSQVSVAPSTFNCGNIGANTVTLTANDGHGNTGTCTAIVTVTDNIAPTATCKAYTANLDAAGSASVATSNVFLSGSDNCGTVNQQSVSPNTFNCNNLGANTVTLTVNDGHGNTNTCTATVTVVDAMAPTVVCKVYTANLDAAGSAIVSTGNVFLSGTDNCGTVNQVSVSPNTFNCNNLGANTVTLTVNDGHGNTNTCSATVTVVDVMAPTVSCKTYTANLDAAGSTSVSTGNVFLSGTDNCGTVNQVSVSPSSFNCSNIGANTVTLTVNDGHGNTGTCNATVTVADAIAPTAVCKAFTANLDAAGSASVSTGNVFLSGADNCGMVNQQSVSPSSFNCNNLGANTVTLTVNDGHGNTGTCNATVTVVDNMAPTVVCKAYTANLDNAGSTSITTANVFLSGSDNCGAVNQVSVSPSSFNCNNLGANTVTLTVNDGHGNTGTCTATVTVADAIAPTVVCKAYTANLNAAGSASITTGNVFQSGADNCGTVNQQSVSPSAFTCSNIGVNTVTLTVNDGHGNTGTCNATVTVVDAIAPTVICKAYTANLDNAGAVTVTTGNVFQSGSDNCGVVNQVSVSPNTFNCTNLGANSVTLTVNDGHGNTNSCTATVTVVDALAPTMLCRNVTLSLDGAGQATLTVAQVNNGSFDNCSISYMELSRTLFTCANIGANTVTLGGKDASNNRAECSATITVEDHILPVAKCKNVVANIGDDGMVKVAGSAVDNGSTDNCSVTFSLLPGAFNCSNIGVNTVTLIATDAGGNTATCAATVTVRDISAPLAKCKNATVYIGADGHGTLLSEQMNNGSTDNCGIASWTLSQTQFNCSDLSGSSYLVTMTIRDMNGNSSACAAYVTVKDVLAPTAVCEDVTVSLGSNGTVVVYGAALAASSTDNCAVWSYTPVAKVYTAANLGANNLPITVKDWSGNAATCVSVVTVLPYTGFTGPSGEDRDAAQGAKVSVDVGLRLYPNPTAGDAVLEFELPGVQQYTLLVYDLAGRIVLLREGEGAEGWNSLPIAMGNVAPGVYLLELRSEGLKGNKRLIIQE